MATIGTLTAYIQADTGQFSQGIDRAERETKGLERQTRRSSDGMSKSFKAVGTAVATYFTVQAVSQFGRAVYQAGVQAEGLERAFKAITGSAEAANKEMAFLRNLSDRLGSNFFDLAGSYKSLLAASKTTNLTLGQTQEIFTSVVEASRALGLSSMSTERALNALSQMMSKGNVSAEELRQQLGEQLPGAFGLAAEAMGVSTSELNKMLEQGQVLAEDMLPRLATLLRGEYSAAAESAADSTLAAVDKMRESWMDLRVSIFQAGIGDAMGEGASAATEALVDMREWVDANEESISAFISRSIEAGTALAQDMAPAIGTTLHLLGRTVDIWQGLPEYVRSAAGYGMIGTALFGGKAGKAVAVVTALNGAMETIADNLRDVEGTWSHVSNVVADSLPTFSSIRDNFAGLSRNMNVIWTFFTDGEDAARALDKRYRSLSSETRVLQDSTTDLLRADREQVTEMQEKAAEVAKVSREFKAQGKAVDSLTEEYEAWQKQMSEDRPDLGLDDMLDEQKSYYDSIRTVQSTTLDDMRAADREYFEDQRRQWEESDSVVATTFRSWRSAQNAAIGQMVRDFSKGENAKQAISKASKNVLVGTAEATAQQSLQRASGYIMDMIAGLIAQGAAGSGAWGSAEGGFGSAMAKIGAYTTTAIGAMLAARQINKSDIFGARGGWMAAHPQGGKIHAGGGQLDDVLLGQTATTRHWAMGGEYVVNKQATKQFLPLLQMINEQGLANGGMVSGAQDKMAVAATTSLGIGAAGAFTHGAAKGGELAPLTALGEMLLYFATAVPAMFASKFLSDKLLATGGPVVDQGYGIGDVVKDLFGDAGDWIEEAANTVKNAVESTVNSIGDRLGEEWDMLMKYGDMNTLDWIEEIATRSAAFFINPALGLSTPGVATSTTAQFQNIMERVPMDELLDAIMDALGGPLDTLGKNLVDPVKRPGDVLESILDTLASPGNFIQDFVQDHLQTGSGYIPQDGVYALHQGEKVVPQSGADNEPMQPIQVNLELEGRQLATVLLDISKDGVKVVHERGIDTRI